MRPRLKAAENLYGNSTMPDETGASMRPRLKAAENVRDRAPVAVDLDTASMRPRLKAAENGAGGLHRAFRVQGFNEAAA